MSLISKLGETVLGAVFLVGLGCSGGDGFEPAPGATVEEGDLEALIEAAVANFDLEWRASQPEPYSEDMDGRPSCFEVESGPCRIPQPPGLAVALQGEGGVEVLVRVGLGIDKLEAGDRVDSAITGRSYTETQTLRVIYEMPEQLGGYTGGPCDYKADRESDDGCAWEERGAPNVGDEARAMKSETAGTTALSAVAFAREHLFADIEVVRRGDSDAPNGLADDLAHALDEQIKAALSQ